VSQQALRLGLVNSVRAVPFKRLKVTVILKMTVTFFKRGTTHSQNSVPKKLTGIGDNITNGLAGKDVSSVFSIDSQIFAPIHKYTRFIVDDARRTASTRGL
jgi:hypothetical protein